MNTTANMLREKPSARPQDPRFSSGPCKKHPGWDITRLQLDTLGRSHRADPAKPRLQQAIERSATLLQLPEDWQLAIVPASDTGAFELALWSMLGARGVDVFVWESFSNDWATDVSKHLKLTDINIFKSDYGELPDLSQATPERDVIFVFNGTTSGVRVPHLDWIEGQRDGLVFCDATSAAFAMSLDFQKLDVVTWSWQKVLGGEGGFGMLALSPKAIERLESYQADRPLPKIFRLTKGDKVNQSVFAGATINTPSMLAVADLHSALDWVDSIGGLPALIQRCEENFSVIDAWVNTTTWIDWLASEPATRSTTSMCLKIADEKFLLLDDEQQRKAIAAMCQRLQQEGVAYDINAYRSAPPGFRVWGGATVESGDLEKLTHWLDWTFTCWIEEQENEEVA